MLDSDVESFLDYSISDLFVNKNAQRSWIYVEDGSGSAVIVFVWHALVNSTINDDVDDVSNFECSKVGRHVNGSVASETFLEFVSGSSLISVTVGHGSKKLINIKNKYFNLTNNYIFQPER